MPVDVNENSVRVRVKSPGLFREGSFKTITVGKAEDGIKAVVGKLKKGDGAMVTQAYIFDKEKWTEKRATNWVAKHKKERPMQQELPSSFTQEQFTAQMRQWMGEAPAEEGDVKTKMYEGEVALASYIPYGATSFADVDEYIVAEATTQRVQELTRQFQTLAGNILYDSEIEDKGAALTSLVTELDDRLGQAVKPKGIIGLLKEAVRSRLIGVVDGGDARIAASASIDKERLRPTGGMFIWKEADAYRWLAVYSNKYLDKDTPPEIISEAAHREFIAAVENKEAPYPELWHFHVPGSRWGVADMLAYDEHGFVIASGTVDKGHEAEAEAVASRDDVRVSHGMLMASVEYDPKQKNVISRYRSIEVSDLPLERAANPLTGFYTMKEGDAMGLPADKKEYLKSVGMTDEAIAQIEADIARKAAQAKEAGLASKEAEAPAPEATPPVETPASEPKPDETPTPTGEGTKAAAPVTLEAVATAIGDVMKEALAPVLGRLDALEGDLAKEKQTQEQLIAKKAADTPAASIAALVMRDLSVRSRKEAEVQADFKPLSPVERKPEEGRTGIPFVDQFLTEAPKQQ